MRARDLTPPFPILPLDSPASEVGRLLAAEGAGVVFLQDPSGGLEGAVTDTRLLWFRRPAYLHQDPALAGVLEEDAAERLRDRLAGRTAGNCWRPPLHLGRRQAEAGPAPSRLAG